MKNQKKLVDLVDILAIKAMELTPGELGLMGDFLAALDECLEATSDPVQKSVLDTVKAAGERMVLADLDDSEENLSKLTRSVVLFQTLFKEESTGRLSSRPEVQEITGIMNEFGIRLNAGSEETEAGSAAGSAHDAEDGPSYCKDGGEKDRQTAEDINDLSFLQDPDLLGDFIAEATEHLDSIEVNILRLEEDNRNREHINSIFRPFHTIKGVAGFLNLMSINRLAHHTENLLDGARNGKLEITEPVIDLILDVVDVLKSMIRNLGTVLERGPDAYEPLDICPLLEQIRAVQEGDTEPVPEVAATVGELLVEQGIATEKDIQDALEIQHKETPKEKLGEILVKQKKAPAKDVAKVLRQQKNRKRKLDVAIKVDLTKLDNMVDLVGELVIVQSLVQQNPYVLSLTDQKLQRDIAQLSRITSALQMNAMSLRMVPISQTFHKMNRLVRDVAKKSGKQVKLKMSGEDTEIDRNMVEAIYDPLVHMIRNAVDHGIELPEDRKKSGKEVTGSIRLRAFQKGGSIIIEIEDDGKGLNREKILEKARSRELIREEDIAAMTDNQIDNLIFLPGFSTANRITDVSGRGVGMDVVRRAIEKLRGKVEIHSTPGKGSVFTMNLPLTLAIIDGIIVRIGPERYIIPTIAVKETLRPGKQDYHTIHGQGQMIKVRQELLPLVRLYELFGITPETTEPAEALMVIVENEGRQRCLMVDDLIGKQEVVIKNLGRYLASINGIAGGTILGDGQVGLIIDIAGIFESSEYSYRAPPPEGSLPDSQPVNAEHI